MISQTAEWILENRYDFYGILSVERTATESAIRRSYYQLALKLHPDKCGEDANAAEAFRLVNQAYGVLSNPKKRNMYDILGSKALMENPSVFEEEISFADGICTLCAAMTYLVVRTAARRTMQEEWVAAVLRRHFGERFGKDDDDTHSSDCSSFSPPHDHPGQAPGNHTRSQTRRLGRCIFVVVSVLFCLAVAVSSLPARVHTVRPTYAWHAAASSPHVIDDATQRTTHVLLRDPHAYFTRPKPATFALDCPITDRSSHHLSTEEHDRRRAGMGGGDGADRIHAIRFAGSEADGRAALRAYLDETCAYEMLLVDASRGRQAAAGEKIDDAIRTRSAAHEVYTLLPQSDDDAAHRVDEGEITVPSTRPVHASNSTCTVASAAAAAATAATSAYSGRSDPRQNEGHLRMKRRYPVKPWQPRYKPVFTVRREDERFVMSDICTRYTHSSCWRGSKGAL